MAQSQKMGIPSAKLAFNPQDRGKGTTLPLRQIIMECCSERLGLDPDIDHEKSKFNRYESSKFIITEDGKRAKQVATGADVYAYCKQRKEGLDEQRAKLGMKPIRKDYIPLCATILKPNYKFMRTLSEEQQDQFLHDAVEELAKIVGKENIVMACYHWDEQTPHVHVLWEPVVREKGEIERFAGGTMHNAKFLGRLNREIVPGLKAKGWDLAESFDWETATKEQREERVELEKSGQIVHGMSSAEYKEHQQSLVRGLEKSVDDLLEQRGELSAEIAAQQEQLEQGLQAFQALQRQLDEGKQNMKEIKQRTYNALQQQKLSAILSSYHETDAYKAACVFLQMYYPQAYDALKEEMEFREKQKQAGEKILTKLESDPDVKQWSPEKAKKKNPMRIEIDPDLD